MQQPRSFPAITLNFRRLGGDYIRPAMARFSSLFAITAKPIRSRCCPIKRPKKSWRHTQNHLVEQYFGPMPECGSGEKRITLRIPAGLANRLATTAAAKGSDVNKYVQQSLEKVVASDERDSNGTDAKASNGTDAKAVVISLLRQGPLLRRKIRRHMQKHGFSKNSVGPICHELKVAGILKNPQRGLWALAEGV
jgi:hypothetical protein